MKVYLKIQQTRFKKRLQLNFNIQESIDQALVPPLILQPVVENAIKYAVEPILETGIIDINIRKQNKKLCIIISDNGKGKFDQTDFNSGIGLTNTKERLQQLYGESHVFKISANDFSAGVMVYFEIPFQLDIYEAIESTYS